MRGVGISLIAGFALMIIYIVLTEITDREAKKKQMEIKGETVV